MNRENLTLLFVLQLIFLVGCKKDVSSTYQTVKISETIDSTFELLIGTWFVPHDAGINITFNRDTSFVFNDFNTKLLKEEVLRGKFQLKPDKLILIYNDRPQQIFNFKKGKGTDDNYYITKGKNYYFVKSD